MRETAQWNRFYDKFEKSSLQSHHRDVLAKARESVMLDRQRRRGVRPEEEHANTGVDANAVPRTEVAMAADHLAMTSHPYSSSEPASINKTGPPR